MVALTRTMTSGTQKRDVKPWEVFFSLIISTSRGLTALPEILSLVSRKIHSSIEIEELFGNYQDFFICKIIGIHTCI